MNGRVRMADIVWVILFVVLTCLDIAFSVMKIRIDMHHFFSVKLAISAAFAVIPFTRDIRLINSGRVGFLTFIWEQKAGRELPRLKEYIIKWGMINVLFSCVIFQLLYRNVISGNRIKYLMYYQNCGCVFFGIVGVSLGVLCYGAWVKPDKLTAGLRAPM